MANENEVRAKTENLDRIVGEFEKDLSKYLMNMKAYVEEINVLFSQLSANWSGIPFDNFNSKMKGPRASIDGALKRGEAVDAKLIQIKNVLAVAVEKMRQGGSK